MLVAMPFPWLTNKKAAPKWQSTQSTQLLKNSFQNNQAKLMHWPKYPHNCKPPLADSFAKHYSKIWPRITLDKIMDDPLRTYPSVETQTPENLNLFSS